MQVKTDYDIVVIGGGIIGLASAYKIIKAHPGIRVAVLEKEDRLAAHQTGRNSGVIHSGLYYKPGSIKAATCAAGRKELIEFAKEHGIPHEICGKLIVATDPAELPTLERIRQNGSHNRIEGLKQIGPERIQQIEPFAAGIAALHVPSAGIIDFAAVANKLAELIQGADSPSRIFLQHEVQGFDKHDFYTNVLTSKGTFSTRCLINCAGLQSDRIARMDGIEPSVRIVPFRGDYLRLSDTAAGKIKNLIYPVPDLRLPFVGTHFTRMIDGSVECGPNAVFSLKREGYAKIDFSLCDTWESLSYAGTWLLFARYWWYGLNEFIRSIWKQRLVARLQRLIPSITPEDFQPAKAGVRAQALGPRGELIDDFQIETRGNAIHILNAPSPAATACLAIGEHINHVATRQFALQGIAPVTRELKRA